MESRETKWETHVYVARFEKLGDKSTILGVHARVSNALCNTGAVANNQTETSSYSQRPPTCFGQSCGHLHGGKIQRMNTSKSKGKR
jgi:hypothetical protein